MYIPATRGGRTTDPINFSLAHVQTPTTCSEDQPANITEGLVAVLPRIHPPTPITDQGTKTNDTIQKLKEIFQPEQKNQSSRMIGATATRVTGAAVPREAERLSIVQENEMGTEIVKRFNNKIYRGIVTKYYVDKKTYLVSYEDNDGETMNHKQINR